MLYTLCVYCIEFQIIQTKKGVLMFLFVNSSLIDLRIVKNLKIILYKTIIVIII